MTGPYYVGVDLGGTQLRMAGVSAQGELATEVLAVPTGPEIREDELAARLGAMLAQVRGALGQPPAALGVGVAGVVNGGPLTGAENLPHLNGVDIVALAGQAAGCPVAMENDARCFTLAEARFGAGRGARDVCGLTLGTSIGCGLMVGGRFLRGATSSAGEVWCMPVRGRRIGEWLSGPGVLERYRAAGGPPEVTDAATVASRARDGDQAARAAWEGFGADLGVVCEWVIGLVDPELIVIGGSMSRARDLFGAGVETPFAGRTTRLAVAKLGTAAGVVGAAALNIPQGGGG
jgi:glucokinase